MSLLQIYLAGEVHRWHANAAMAREGQTNADHQGRAAQLLLALNRDASPALIYVVLHHDVGEAWAGDLPQPFKSRCPEIARAHAAIEADMASAIVNRPMPDLTAIEADWLRLVDKLEALMFVLHRRPAEYYRARSGWRDDHASVQALADRLGCGPAVEALIRDLKDGIW
ncbi:MAG: hypothetical protein V4659_03965 [Pseudomonadota bacterium]